MMKMQNNERTNTYILTVIGCGDAFSSGGNNQTCFHVQTPFGSFLIDCGAGALAGLKKNDLYLAEIDTIIISHFHGDHYGGLPYLLQDRANERQKEPLTILSPPGCKEKIQQLITLLYPGSKMLEKLNLHFISYQDEVEITLPYLTVTPISVAHKPESLPYGVRICTGEKIIAYSGDTAWTEQLLKIASRSDLFICECCFYETEVEGHLNYQNLKKNIDRLSTRQILLTHFDDEMLTNRDKLALPLAYDGLRLLV